MKELTSAQSRKCSATPRSRRRRNTPTWRRTTCWRCTTVPIRGQDGFQACGRGQEPLDHEDPFHEDRKSTRLNSSHVRISYAVFCLKKKNNISAAASVATCS